MILSACGKGQIVLTTGFGEDEIFRVEEFKCTDSEVMVYLYNLHGQYESAYGSGIWSAGGSGVDLKENLKQTVLARLAKVKIMNIMAGHYQVSLSNGDKAIAQQAARTYYSSLSDAQKAIMRGVDEAKLTEMYEEYAVASRLYDKLTEGVNTEISDDEARVVKLHQIALLKERTAEDGTIIRSDSEELRSRGEELKKRIDDGEDFDTLAYSCNEAEELSVNLAKGDAPAQVEELCFNLAEGEVGGPVVTDQGVCLFKCISTYDRQQTDERKLKLAAERKKAAFDGKYEEFSSGMEIYLNEELWNSISPDDISGIGDMDFFEIYEKMFG